MRRRGVAPIVVFAIIVVVLVGAALVSQYLYQNRNVTDIEREVISRDYKSYSGEYSKSVKLDLGPLEDTVTWDEKAVAEIAIIGKYIKIQGVPFYLIDTPSLYKATKGHDPPIMGTCYRARIPETHLTISYGDYGEYTELKVPLSQWSQWSVDARAYFIQFKISEEQDAYYLKIPVFSYLIQGSGTVAFDKGYDSLFSNGCKDWQNVGTSAIRTPSSVVIQVGTGP